MSANDTTTPSRRPALRRVRRIAAWTGMGAGAVVVLVVVALLLPPVRGMILRTVLDRAAAALPGTITTESASWPGLGTIDVTGLVWTDEGDTLARADHLRVQARIGPLLHRDVVVENVELTGAAADVPAIVAQFPSAPDTTVAEGGEGGGSAFPRAGSIAGVPSIAVRRLHVSADSIRVGEGDVLAGIEVVAAADLLHGGHPAARIERLTVHGRAQPWGVEDVDVEIDLSRGVVDGHIDGRAGYWPFFVTLSSGGEDNFVITVTTESGATPPDDVGARIVLDLERHGLSVERVGVTADIHTPGVEELAADPALSEALASAPPLEGITARIEAAVALTPAPAVDATVQVEPNAWLEGVDMAASWRDRITDVPHARITLDGLTLDARARVTPDSLRARVDATATSGEWLAAFRPARRGEGDAPGLDGRVVVNARAAMPPERVDVDLIAEAMKTWLGVSAEISTGEALAVELSPLLLRTTPIAAAPARGRNPGVVRRAANGALSARGVRVTGDYGNARIDADLDRRGAGEVTAALAWPQLPAVAVDALGLEPAPADSLRRLWSQHGPFTVDARTRLGTDTRAHVTVNLPGPRTLAPLLPAGAEVTDLGNITGTVDATIAGGTGAVAVTADLGATAWIDTARAVVRVSGDTVAVDTLALSLPTLAVSALGTVLGDSLDLDTRLRVSDASFLRRFVPGLPDLKIALDAAVTGARTAPGVAADLRATAAGIDVAGRARIGGDGADITLDAPGGLSVGAVTLDAATVHLSNGGAGTRLFPATVTVDASGKDVGLYHSATIDTAGGFTLAADTLRILLGGRDLTSRQPFTVRAGPEPGRIVIDGVDLAGSLGHLSADAELCADSVVADADIDVNMPDKPESLALPENYWPESVTARVHARADGALDADVRVGGVTLADGSRPDVELAVNFAGDSVTVLAAITAGDSLLLDARGRIPARLSLSPFAFDTGGGDADIEIHMRGIPVSPRMQVESARVMRISGDGHIVGTVSAPAGSLSATIEFPGWPKLSDYRVTFESTLNAGTGDDALDADLQLLRGGSECLQATVSYAGALSMEPPFVPEDGGRLQVHARSDSLTLSEFDNLLPADFGLEGTLQIQLDATGPPRNPALDGRFGFSHVEVTVQQRMRLVSDGEVTVAGNVAEPVVRGQIVIENGVIQIPDPPKVLHPVTGKAMLVEQHAAGIDTSALTPELPATEPDAVPGDVDVTVKIPGGLWIRGQGLELELAGDLRLRTHEKHPALTGNLRAVRGNLILLGRNFKLERGTVVFYGDDDANPSLDVQLSTNIDGVKVTVEVTGTAAEPELNLRSSPEMEQGDIMSYLVFGRPLDNLNENQKGLVETRATEIAAAMGAVRLQDELREQLGVDLVTIRQSTADEEASALVVGKYINPRLLVKYEQLLEEQAAQFINIEYFLTRRLKLETLYGRHDQAGVEIEWSNDY